MAGRKERGHLEQTVQLSSLGSVISAKARQRKPPIKRGQDRGREVGFQALLHQRANNIALILD